MSDSINENKVEKVLDEVKEIIRNQLNLDKDAITLESEIIKDLGADSLDIIEMIMSFEDKYGITVPEDVSAQLKTVGDVVNLIVELIEKKN